MRTTVDAAGRITIPKPMRDSLGLASGQQVVVIDLDGHLEIHLPPSAIRLERHSGVLVAVPERDVPVWTASDVRDVLERVRLD